ncbi:hypothetical protein RSAG8_08090, partial [Rhizoctonia solani AG-8 WAC10335]
MFIVICIGSCATGQGRNRGHFTAFTFIDYIKRAETHRVDEVPRSAQLEQHTVSSIPKLLDASTGGAEEVDLVRQGLIYLPFTDAVVEAIRRDMEAAKQAGVDLDGVECLAPEETEQRFRVERSVACVPGNTLWPLKLVTKLFRAAKEDTVLIERISPISLG